jgi:hypothetical protein
MRKTQYFYRPLERGLKVEMPSETCLRQVIDSIGNSIIVPDAPNGSGEASGDLAYDSGFIQYWIKGNNGPVKGFYLMVLKRDSEGKWHIVRHALTEISTRYSSPSK